MARTRSKLGLRLGLSFAAAIVALGALASNVGAGVPSSAALSLEGSGDWFLTEGSGPIEASSVRTEGMSSLRVGGAYWRRVSSVALASEGEPLSTFSLDVRLDAAAEPWEAIGVVLKAPSVGVWWSDLGQASLVGAAPGTFQRKSFALPEPVRQAIRTATDLTILISLNTRGAVQLDRGALFNVPAPPPDRPDPIQAPSDPARGLPKPCAAHDLHVATMAADFADIWAGRESPDTGKQAEPDGHVALTFDAPVNPALVVGAFMPQQPNCGMPVQTRTRNWERSWSTVVPALGAQQFPRDFNVVVLDTATGIADSAGPIATGGKLTLRSFSVNQSTQQPFAVVSGGQVDLASGSIRGNVAYGSASSIPGTVSISGSATLSSPLDIEGGFANLRALSQGLSNLPATGTATLAWSTLTLSGSEVGLNVFDVDAGVLGQARSVALLVPSGATALVNITGSVAGISNVGFSLGGSSRNKLLWNATQAHSVTLSGLSLPGSLLAPAAAVTFANGNLEGTLVARSLSGGGAFRHYPLDTAAFFSDGHADLAANTVEIDPVQALMRGCKYAFVIAKAQPLTQDGQCLAANLTVPFYVAKLGSAAGRELEPKIADAALGTLRRFSIHDGINTPVDAAWARYASRLRLGGGDLVPASNAVASPVVSGASSTFYQQQFHGVPVFAHGYFAHSKDGNLRAALGKVAPGLTLSVEPSLTESAALHALTNHLGLSSPLVDGVTGLPLEGTLEIYAATTHPSAADFKLVWRFSLATTPAIDALARVDATTGQVSTSNPRAVPYLDPAAVYLGQTDRDVSTLFDGSQSINTAAFRSNSQDEFALSSGGLDGLGTTGVVLYTGSAASTDAEPGTWPFEWPSDTDPTWSSPLSQRLASTYWAGQTARAFGDSLALEFDGGPWLGLDGSGDTPVRIWYDTTTRFLSRDGSANAYFYGDEDSLLQANFVVAASASRVPADLEVLAHEQFHGMLGNARKRVGLDNLVPYREPGAIGEGLADIFGVAAVHAMTPEDSEWACLAIGGVCARNVATPISYGMPARYLDAKYIDFAKYTDAQCNADPATDACGRHNNSTVVSHWGYLLAKGSDGPVADACNVEVVPLADTIDQSLGDVLNVIFQAASSQLVADADFGDLRDATVAVAEGYLGDEGARKIEAAWSAVGVGAPPSLANVKPPDGATDIDPWYATIQWSSLTDGPWDLVISEDPAFTTVVGTMEVASAESSSGGVFSAYASAALSPNKRYYWRVKKHGAADGSCWLVTRSFDTAQKEVEIDASIKKENGYYQTGFLGELSWGVTGFYHDDLIRLSDKREVDGCSSDTVQWEGGRLAFGDSFDALYERFGFRSFGSDLDPDTTYYFYIQPTWESTFTGQLEKGRCSEFKVRKQHLGAFEALRPQRSSLTAVLMRNDTRPDRAGMVMVGDDNAFAFTPSDGAVSYELTITTTDENPVVIYDVTRPVDHCAIGHRNNQGQDDGVLRWWLTNHPVDPQCTNGELDSDPALLDFVHTSDLKWNVYALGADGERRSSWHHGDEQQAPGISAENRFFNWRLADLPPKVGDRLLITAGFHADVTGPDGSGHSEVYDLSDVRYTDEDVTGTDLHAIRYEQTFSFPAGSTVGVSPFVALVTSPPAPIMNGVRVWFRRDDETWVGPVAVWGDDDLSGLLSFNVPATGATLEMLYLPMEFEWGGPGRDRIASLSITHLVSKLGFSAAAMPEPAKPQPACSAPPSAPLVEEYYRFNEDTDLNVPPCSLFKLAPFGLFGFSWSDVPGAVKYRIRMSSPWLQSWLPDVVLDRSAARCDGSICRYQTSPPFSPALGCPTEDGTHYLSGYYFFISAIDSCAQEGPAGAGTEGYLGPQ